MRSSSRQRSLMAMNSGTRVAWRCRGRAIGTGIAGFPLERCAEVMLEEVRDRLRGTTSLKRVEMVLFDASALRVFEGALARMTD